MNESPDFLLLIPTVFERDRLSESDNVWFDERKIRVETIGFGPVSAAARTSQLLGQRAPRFTILMGIAGSYAAETPIGSAIGFSEVAMYGIGIGAGAAFKPAAELGWAQFTSGNTAIGDRIELQTNARSQLLVTTSNASADPSEAAQKLQQYPTAMAEDMEGFGVAVACQLHHCPLAIFRGISNRAGDRDKSNWRIEAAIRSAAQMVRDFILELPISERIGRET